MSVCKVCLGCRLHLWFLWLSGATGRCLQPLPLALHSRQLVYFVVSTMLLLLCVPFLPCCCFCLCHCCFSPVSSLTCTSSLCCCGNDLLVRTFFISFVSMVSSIASACHCYVPLLMAEEAMHVCNCHMLQSLSVFIPTIKNLQAASSALPFLASWSPIASSRSGYPQTIACMHYFTNIACLGWTAVAHADGCVVAGVATGAVFGHAIATAIAVIGGSIASQYISEKTIGYIGGILFLVFAVATGLGYF